MMQQPAFGLFSLFAVFDVIAVFAVYIICLQLTGQPIGSTLAKDVIDYTFQSSLFDCIVNAAFRMLALIFVHLIYRSTSRLAVAMTTVVTTVFTIVKVFLYRYPYQDGNAAFVYVVIFSNFLVSWVEIWLFFVTIANPQSQLDRRDRATSSFVVIGSEDLASGRFHPVMAGSSHFTRYGATSERYFSAAGSDDDEASQNGMLGNNNRRLADQAIEEEVLDETDKAVLVCEDTCLRLVDEVFRLAFPAREDAIAWRPLSGFEDCVSVCVADPSVISAEFRVTAPIFRVVLDLNASFNSVRQVLIDDILSMPKWHPFVPESRLLEKMSTKHSTRNLPIDIVYQTSQPALGGFVSARDFVNLRHVGVRDGVVFSASIGTAHPQCTPKSGYVRGETGPCAYMVVSQASQYVNSIKPQQQTTPGLPVTRFVWIVCSDVKGGLPSGIVNRAMQYAIRKFISDLRAHLATFSSSPSPVTEDEPLLSLDDDEAMANNNNY